MLHWNSKRDCRTFFRSLTTHQSPQVLVQNQLQFNPQLLSFLSQQSGTWGAYRALPGELSVDAVFQAQHIKWIFPRVQGMELEFCASEGKDSLVQPDQFVVGAFQILEPPADCPVVSLQSANGLLIPALAYSKNGDRLGKGKGFYDRALENFQGVKVGVCFDFQVTSEALPVEDHDVRVDFLLTPSGLYPCRQYHR